MYICTYIYIHVYIYIKISVRSFGAFGLFGFFSTCSLENTAIYDTWRIPASKTPLQPCSAPPVHSKSLLQGLLGAA